MRPRYVPIQPDEATQPTPDAAYLEHRRCGKLEAEIYEGEPAWIVMVCNYSARLARRIELDESRDR